MSSAEQPRKLLVRCEAETNPRYGHYPHERPVDEYLNYGFINLDKPRGPTSHEVVAWVKRILSVERAAHGGTLDPKVSGVLPIALQRATPLIKLHMQAGKEYVCVMTLHGDVSESRLREVCSEFIGPIYQRPPLRSSVKRALRIRRIHYIEILEMRGRHVLIKVGCEAGTYIRKLVHDIGEVLGVGAHMRELRRTRAGTFTEEDNLVTLQDVADAYAFWKEEGDDRWIRKVIMPMEVVLANIPKVYIRDSAVDAICHGADLAVPGVVKLEEGINQGDTVAIMTLKGELIALGKALMTSEQMLQSEKGLAVNTERVIMKPGTYPKMW
ncbi:MAG TPA: RNA-guided pseudouridylation complex pseudouridine synthase subunit Cbf5 [Candidatus Methanomethylia archaeon]|nr:RNA-guided pseudouridylation complex pseudouridine synthase subunit Cbf5 [Candidatus Methanomethylicia archaeon]